MMHLSSWVEYLSEDCESISEDVLIVEPDIDNSTATGEDESSAGGFSRGTNLIPKKEVRKCAWCYYQL